MVILSLFYGKKTFQLTKGKDAFRNWLTFAYKVMKLFFVDYNIKQYSFMAIKYLTFDFF